MISRPFRISTLRFPHRKVTFLICGLLSLTSIGVRCLAIGGENRNYLKKCCRLASPKHVLGQIHKRRGGGMLPASPTPDDPIDDVKPIIQPDLSEETDSATGTEAAHSLSSTQLHADENLARWPCLDELDRQLIKISLPVIANYAINPLIGAVDLFWVNRMGNALAVAGQAAANQVFSSAFWCISFLPAVTATLVSKKYASGDKEGTQDAVCQAFVVGCTLALLGSALLWFNPDLALRSVLTDGAPALEFAKPYLTIRSFSFLPSIISVIGFSAFRGVLDTRTPVKISAFANLFNAVLDPILIFTLAMGVSGAAVATVGAEVISAVTFLELLRRRNLIVWSKIFSLPSWKSLKPLIQGGLALQLRNLAFNITFLAVARVTQGIDKSGVAAAAHAMAIQTFQVGGVVLLAISTVAQTIVPNAMVERYDEDKGQMVGGLRYAKSTVNRMMSWGFVLGTFLASIQLLLLPSIKKATPLQEVRDAATMPAIIGSVLQIINGLVFIGEGVMIGTGSFMQLSLSTVVATSGCLVALRVLPGRIGLAGVWMGFAVWNVLRLTGVWIHQTQNGPLTWRNIDKATQKT